jgi:outer membrane lipoprotein-sorting protein
MKEVESWHLSRSVNVAHILVVLALFISGFVYVSNIKEDVALHGQQITHNTESIKDGKSEMHQITKQINTKLDKIFDMLYKLGKT